MAALTGAAPARDGESSPAGVAPRFRPDVQGLRAVAVLLVIGNHAGIPGLSGGYIGVDVFFVISGYVITQLLLREADRGLRSGLADFYSRRIRRIVPAASLTLMATAIAAQVALGAGIDPNLPGDLRWASLFSANLRLIHTGSDYFIPGLHPSLVTQFWSLAVEEQFYLIYPLFVFLVARSAPEGKRNRILFVGVGAGVLLSAWYSSHLTAINAPEAYYSPLSRFWELGLGCLLALGSTQRPIRTRRAERLAVGAGAALLLAALVVLDARSAYPGTLAWLPCGAAALILWAGRTGRPNPVTRLLGRDPLTYLGNISYSLYLTHYVWLKLPEMVSSPMTGPGWRVLELMGTFLSAAASYHLVEDPIRRSKALAGDRVAAVLLLLVCVAAVWLTAAVVAHSAF
ncbi:MAG: acyltransferase [Acidobacteriota bacterium]|nr:acyltransferase [Acidobacteriota bacterium]